MLDEAIFEGTDAADCGAAGAAVVRGAATGVGDERDPAEGPEDNEQHSHHYAEATSITAQQRFADTGKDVKGAEVEINIVT